MKKILINHSKLRGKIKEVLGTQGQLAELLKLDETTISNKLNCNTYFTQEEIIEICSILKIPTQLIKEYFFNLKVRENEQK